MSGANGSMGSGTLKRDMRNGYIRTPSEEGSQVLEKDVHNVPYTN